MYSDEGYSAIMEKVALAMLRGGGVPVRSIEPSLKDPISQLVVEALLAHGAQNISHVAEYVKTTKGTSSRKTVRDRMRSLESAGIVERLESESKWKLTHRFLTQCWSFFSGK